MLIIVKLFQDYYENHILKGTSSSTMCALSISFLSFEFHIFNGYHLVALGSAPYKYEFLSNGPTPSYKLIYRPGCFDLFPCAHLWPPSRSWLLSQHFKLRIDKPRRNYVLDRRVPRILAITTLPGLRHWCQCPNILPLLSSNLISNCPLFFWFHIWTAVCVLAHRF